MQHLFYHNYREEKGSFIHSLNAREVHRAITLHPVKEPVHQYRIRNYFSSRHILDLRQKSLNMHREIALMNQEIGLKNNDESSKQLEMFPSLTKYVPDERDDVLSWEYFTKPVYSDANANPKRGMEFQVRSALDDVIMQIMQMVNKNARQRGRTIDFKEILYGYKRTNPQHGADYVLDLLLIYRKHKGRRMTVPVRRHAYLHQTFSQMEFVEEFLNVQAHHNPLPANVVHIFKDFYTKSSDVSPDSSSVIDKRTEKIHFIMPLSGRYDIFQRFMTNYENVILKTSESAVLHVIMFDSIEDMALEKSIHLVTTYQQKYGGDTVDVTQANGPFSRGQGLEMGAAQCKADDLLFFIDVDIMITRDCLYRIRTNTKQGLQAYFPIVFSQYDPQTICSKGSAQCKKSVQSFQTDAGYWRQFGFGIAGLYQKDLRLVGGFDTTIQGWGKEDVDLYHKFLMGNVTIFRAVDPGMVHAFHPIVCEAGLEPTQYQMCLGSKASSYGSTKKLANLVFDLERELQKQTNKSGKKIKS